MVSIVLFPGKSGLQTFIRSTHQLVVSLRVWEWNMRLSTTLLPYLQMSSSSMSPTCSFLSPQLPSLYLYQQSWHHAPFSLFHLLYHVEFSPSGYRLSRSCCGRQSRQSGLARTHGHWQGAAKNVLTVIQFRNTENVSWHWSVPLGSGSSWTLIPCLLWIMCYICAAKKCTQIRWLRKDWQWQLTQSLTQWHHKITRN